MPLIYLNSPAHKAADVAATVRTAIERNRPWPPPTSLFVRAVRFTILFLHKFNR